MDMGKNVGFVLSASIVFSNHISYNGWYPETLCILQIRLT